MAVDLGNHVPAVGCEAARRVVGEPALDVTVDGNAVVVVEDNQFAQAQGARQRAHLVGDPLHETAVAGEDIGEVIDERVAVAVELGRQGALGDGHADGVGEPLTERTGGRLHARCVTDLGMPGGHGMQLPEAFDLLQGQIVAAQVQQGIEQHGAVPVGEHEAIAIRPGGIRGIVLEEVVPQHFGDVRHAHGRAGVAGVGLLDGVHGQSAYGVGEI